MNIKKREVSEVVLPKKKIDMTKNEKPKSGMQLLTAMHCASLGEADEYHELIKQSRWHSNEQRKRILC